jgi:hypothetical protein
VPKGEWYASLAKPPDAKRSRGKRLNTSFLL